MKLTIQKSKRLHDLVRRSLLSRWLLIAIGWQLLLTVVGVMISLKSGSLPPSDALTVHMNHWDAGWYLHVIAFAYGPEGSPATPAFYPLFPLLVSLLSYISFGLLNSLAAGLVINTVALWLALVALYRIVSSFTTSRDASAVAAALFLAFPSAFFMHAFYGEAVFTVLGFWAYSFALQKRWRAMGLVLAVLTAARLPALLFVGLCALEYLRAYNWNLRQALNPKMLWFLIAPLGIVLYSMYLAIVRHDFLAMFHAYTATNDWTSQVLSPNILATIGHAALSVATAVMQHQLTYDVFINKFLPLTAIAALLTCAIYCLVRLRSRGVPLFLFGVSAIVLFTLNSNVVSVHRYVLPCIVIYIAAALFYQRGWRAIVLWLAVAGCLALQLYLYVKFLNDIFAG